MCGIQREEEKQNILRETNYVEYISTKMFKCITSTFFITHLVSGVFWFLWSNIATTAVKFSLQRYDKSVTLTGTVVLNVNDTQQKQI